MNSQSILKAKIAYLSGNSHQDINDAMKEYVANHPELAQEIQFIEAFWHGDNNYQDEQPSTHLDARFYQMLNQAQSAQTSNTPLTKSKSPWLQLYRLISPRPIIQSTLLVLVFMFGYMFHKPQELQQYQSIARLQQQIQSLNSLVALSMINSESASERLNGIRYTQQTSGNQESLNSVLLTLLNTDSSTAVRLAVINALASRNNLNSVETALLSSISRQKHPLVQIALIKLLTDKSEADNAKKLFDLSTNHQLSAEANDFLQQLKPKQAI